MKGLLRKIVLVCLFCWLQCIMTACEMGGEERKYDQALSADEAKNLDWEINFSLVQDSVSPRLYVKQSFKMPRRRLFIRLPDTYLRKEKLYQRIEQLSVSNGASLSDYPESSAVKILEAPLHERVTLEYYFRPDDPVSYTEGKESFSAPIIRNDYFQFVGSMVLLYPDAIAGASSLSLRVNWQLPTGFRVYNSFASEQMAQKIETDFDKLRDAFAVAGQNIRVHHISVRNRPVTVTFEGQWDEISDNEFVDVVQRLLSKQRETFNDDDFPYFLVNFLADEQACDDQVKFAGTAHPNSFRAIFPGRKGCKLIPEMRQLISHELVHMWIGKKIRVGSERGHIDGKWFTEGFTDYFGRILAYRAGVLTQPEYFHSLNRQLEKYYTSNERMVTLRGLVDRMYRRNLSNRDLEAVPYQQGEIMAWRLNKRIKVATLFKNSLDDVIRDMLSDAMKAGGQRNFSANEINGYFDRYAPSSFRQEFGKILAGGIFVAPKLASCSLPEASYSTRYQRWPLGVSDAILFYGTSSHNCDTWLK